MENVINFRPRTAADDSERTAHAERVRASVTRLEAQVKGMSEPDRLAMMNNIGDLVEGRARDRGLNRREALKQVWKRFDPKHELWAKRLRYVRFRDETTKGNELAASGKQFVTITSCASTILPTPGVSPERDLVAALAALMRGTTFDPDPMASARVDFDAAKDLGELLSNAVSRIVTEVPGLPEYFRRIEMHGLVHPDSEHVADIQSDALHMQPFDMQPFDYFHAWDQTRFEAPAGDRVRGSSPASATNLREGFWFEAGVGTEALLPRTVLGRIAVTRRLPSVSETQIAREFGLGDTEISNRSDDELLQLAMKSSDVMSVLDTPVEHLPVGSSFPEKDTIEVQMVLVPCASNTGNNVRVGIIVRMPSEVFGPRSPATPQGLQVLCYGDSARRYVVKNDSGQSPSQNQFVSILPRGRNYDTLFLLPGQPAEHVLGVRHTAPEHESEIQPAPVSIEIAPNFTVPSGFAPQAATSLGGMLIRNLLHADDSESLLSHLVCDARARVKRLDHDYQQWMQKYEQARQRFISKSASADNGGLPP